MELMDLKLLDVDLKELTPSYKSRYSKIIDLMVDKKFAYRFNKKVYDCMVYYGVSKRFAERLERKYKINRYRDKLLVKDNYYYSVLLASQFKDCDLCFARMGRVGKNYTACWIERNNYIFDITAGVFYNKYKYLDDFYYRSFGISRDEVVRIPNSKLTEDSKCLDEIVEKLKKCDRHTKDDYVLAYQNVKKEKLNER